MRKGFWLAAVFGAVVLTSCKEDHTAECDLVAKGDFILSVVPRLPSGADSTADIDVSVNAVLDTMIAYSSFIPPTIAYRFRAVPAGWFGTRDIRINDLLLAEEPDPAKRGFPVVQGQTYTLHFELSQQIVPPAMSIRIQDYPQGSVRFFGVNDWRPSGTTGAQIYESGYPAMTPDGELHVIWADGGCQSQSVDFSCYQEWTNRRLDFLIGSNTLGLWSGQEGTLGNWRVIVYKAAKVVGKAGCQEGLLRQNGVSFTVERTGLR